MISCLYLLTVYVKNRWISTVFGFQPCYKAAKLVGKTMHIFSAAFALKKNYSSSHRRVSFCSFQPTWPPWRQLQTSRRIITCTHLNFKFSETLPSWMPCTQLRTFLGPAFRSLHSALALEAELLEPRPEPPSCLFTIEPALNTAWQIVGVKNRTGWSPSKARPANFTSSRFMNLSCKYLNNLPKVELLQ